MRKQKWVFGLVGVLALVAGLAACSHHSPEQRAEWVVSKITSKLDLTEEQKVKLMAVKQAVLAQHKAHEADRANHLAEVKQMILSDHLDGAKAKALVAEKHKAMDAGFDSVFGKVQEFHASLTTEQKQKAVELLDKLSEHW